ncbi:MAG: MFS transporter [Bacteriovoracaceae bacterium]
MSKLRSRTSISGLFFLHGLVFSSWAVRIPAIQEMHGLTEATLGTVLLCKPVASLLCMPVAAKAVEKFGSKKVLLFAISTYGVLLYGIGLMPSVAFLMLNLFLFSFASNLVNISINTQAIALEKLYGKSVMGSLHGLWSMAGFVGGALGALMIAEKIPPATHFLIITGLAFAGAYAASPHLLPDEEKVHEEKKKFFRIPEGPLVLLGVIAFFSLLCEGTMFDWSGIYFKKVVGAEGGWIGAGYTAFMITMAGTRFLSDILRDRIGPKKILLFSGLLIFMGLMLAVLFPVLPVALLGFLLVGSGVSSIIPLVYGLTGKTKVMSPSAAVTAVATTGYFGFLLGPPLIGWIASASSLRISFTLISFMGLMIIALSRKLSTIEQ